MASASRQAPAGKRQPVSATTIARDEHHVPKRAHEARFGERNAPRFARLRFVRAFRGARARRTARFAHTKRDSANETLPGWPDCASCARFAGCGRGGLRDSRTRSAIRRTKRAPVGQIAPRARVFAHDGYPGQLEPNKTIALGIYRWFNSILHLATPSTCFRR